MARTQHPHQLNSQFSLHGVEVVLKGGEPLGVRRVCHALAGLFAPPRPHCEFVGVSSPVAIGQV